MNSVDIVTYVKDAIFLMERIQKDNIILENLIVKSLENIKQHNEEIKSTQNQLNLLLNTVNNYPITSDTTVNQPLKESKSVNEPKQTEPMTVRDAIKFLRRSNVSLSDYGYNLSSSFETRYNALKNAIDDYPLDNILQKLRALIIVWSQNTLYQIKYAEQYLNHLRADFHTLQEESIKPKCT